MSSISSVQDSMLKSEGSKNTMQMTLRSKTQGALCPTHNTTPTARFDAQFHQPRFQTFLRSLSAALSDLADENCCTRCAFKKAVLALNEYVSAKVHGKGKRDAGEEEVSWREVRAGRAEWKGVMRQLKREMREEIEAEKAEKAEKEKKERKGY